jgi:transposase
MSTRHQDIIQYYQNHGKSDTVRCFTGIHFSRRAIYLILERYEKTGSIERKVGSGRKAVKLKESKKKRLLQNSTTSGGQSIRKLSRKFQISKSYVHDILKKNNILFRKRKEAPKVSPAQIIRQESRLQLLSEIVTQKKKTHFVLDDESYFTLTGAQNSGYYVESNKQNEVPDNIRLKFREKFCPKVLVWVAISKRGISSLCIRKSNAEALNSEIYISECLNKHLLPFLKENYPSGHFLFWPDLASCHYSRATLSWLREQKIPFVEKENNPPCAPQIRPIERFWAHLKEKVYEGGWTADSQQQLISRIRRKVKLFDNLYFQKLFLHFTNKIVYANSHGLNSLI